MGTAVTQAVRDTTSKRKALHDRLARRDFVAAPGVFDLISALIADSKQPPALYMTGYGVAASYLGLPDAGLTTYRDMLERAGLIAARTRAPLIADGDTGYGGLLNVQHTVRGYEQAGVCAIQLEDQEFPKKCGHTPGRRVVPTADMVKKIRVAVDSRDYDDFLIIARTDARTTHGLDEALRRLEAYANAGADILFLESPESEAELERIGAAFDQPLLINMLDGGATPILPAARLTELGFALALYPTTGMLAAAAALDRVYGTLAETGSSAGSDDALYSFEAFGRLMGFEAVWEFESRYSDGEQ